MYFVDVFFEGNDEDEAFECRAVKNQIYYIYIYIYLLILLSYFILQDMRELIFQKFDADKDTFISYDEYCTVVRQTPALLEFLGVVRPSATQMNVIMHCINLYMV